MVFAIRRRPPPSPLMVIISRHLFTPLFSFAIESYIDEMDFTLGPIKKYRFKSSFHWFKIDLYQQLRPLTANCLAMFKVTSTTI